MNDDKCEDAGTSEQPERGDELTRCQKFKSSSGCMFLKSKGEMDHSLVKKFCPPKKEISL